MKSNTEDTSVEKLSSLAVAHQVSVLLFRAKDAPSSVGTMGEVDEGFVPLFGWVPHPFGWMDK